MNSYRGKVGLAAVMATATTLAIGPVAEAGTFSPDYSSFENSSVITNQSIAARITKGIATGQGGSMGGAFSEFSSMDGLVEVNFNDLSVSHGDTQFESGGLTFTTDKKFGDNKTDLINENGQNNWAPSNIDGTKNTSQYLGVFHQNRVTVSLGQTMSYFGINWGALSKNNTFILQRGDTEVGRFDYNDLFPVLKADNDAGKDTTVKAGHQNQYNSYLHLYADSEAGLFDTLVLEQASTQGGGFEVDNFSYMASDSSFDWNDSEAVPEPGIAIGLMALAGAAVFRRRVQAVS